ncbi:Lysophospholipid acyltransferase [Cucumispora dikerogammari]|nr:Lysophospholipid acyltransferase [Cucumispora dikerogammari]
MFGKIDYHFSYIKDKYKSTSGDIIFVVAIYSLIIICSIIKHYKLYNFMFIPSILLLIFVFGRWHASIGLTFLIVNLIFIYTLKNEGRHHIAQLGALTTLFGLQFYYKTIDISESVDICGFLMIMTIQFYWIGKHGSDYKLLDVINYLLCPASVFSGPPIPIHDYMLRLSHLRGVTDKIVEDSETLKPNIVGLSEVALIEAPVEKTVEPWLQKKIKEKQTYINKIHPAIIPIILSGIYVVLHLYLDDTFPYTTNMGMLRNYINLVVSGFAFRCKFYFIWTIAEANFYCLGFPNIVNIRPLNIEFATNIKDLTASWNIYTNIWLKESVFDVFKSTNIGFASLLTFFVSSFYHGPNICYPLMFLTFSIIVPVIKQNNMVMKDNFNLKVTKALNVIVFISIVAYLAVPFRLLSLKRTLYVWKGVYFYGHLFLISCILFHSLRGMYK